MKKVVWWFLSVSLIGLVIGGCGANPSAPPTPTATSATASELQKGDETMTFELASSAFANSEGIPAKYTCDGEDVSPPLQWNQPPEGVQSLALIMDDPDAPVGTWDHWLLFNIPADFRSLAEQAGPPPGSVGGKNSWGRTGYGGPCPPRGTHRYFFRLYALDTSLDLPSGTDKAQLIEAMAGHILAQAELMGTYARK
jgi:Raf kinase inhibitor-like YbhB/YbcL family protein